MSITPDTIHIKDLQVAVRVGDTPEERAFPQLIWISIDIRTPLEAAARKDNISETVDYAAVVHSIKKSLGSRTFQLIEAVATNVANLVLEQPRAESVRVLVEKKVFPDVERVGVSMERHKTPS